jgi:hypothetical protein
MKNPSIELEIDELGGEIYTPAFIATIEYEYQASSYDDHPYGSTTARQHYGAAVQLIKLTLKTPAAHYDGDTDTIQKEYPVGFDVTKLPGWSTKESEHWEEQVLKALEGDGAQ